MKKSFGQNLLIDEKYLHKIIEVTDLKPDDIVLEIGSGSGLLTVLLAKRVKKFFAVEPERNVLKSLKYNIHQNKLTNVEIVDKSFLKINLCELLNKPFKVVGNIPYNLTSKILLKLCGDWDSPASHLNNLSDVFLMLQLQVAERLVAKPGTKAYSPLTLLIQYFTEPEILFKVPSTAFSPTPKVESAFVHLKVKSKLQYLENPALLKKVIRSAFQQRRKKLVNALEKLFGDKKVVKEKFNELKLDYKTIRHHLEVLEKNNIIIAVNKGNYGAVYFLSELMNDNIKVFGEIWEQFGKK